MGLTFRCRMYRVVPGKLEVLNDFFLHYLLPVQQRYGAKLVGRRASDNRAVSDTGAVIVALWVYESLDAYETIQRQVSLDPGLIIAQSYRREHLEPLFTETEEWLMNSAVPLERTELSALTIRPDRQS